jgi:hypothetical protein
MHLRTCSLACLPACLLYQLLSTATGLLLGAPLPLLFWGGLAVPFVAAGLAARFWPLLRTIGLDLWERYRHRHKFWKAEEHGGECTTYCFGYCCCA